MVYCGLRPVVSFEGEAMPARPLRERPWWVAVVSGMASYIDSAAINGFSTSLVILQKDLTLEQWEVGVAAGALTLSIAIGALIGGRLGDRFGRRPVFTATMVLVIVAVASLIAAPSFTIVTVGAVLLGLGTGADLPVSLATIAEAATDRNRGRLLGCPTSCGSSASSSTPSLRASSATWGARVRRSSSRTSASWPLSCSWGV